MKIVQKVFSHGLLIAFFVAVFFIYLYRGDLFPQWFDKQAQTEVTPAPSAAAQSPVVSTEEPQPAQASGTDDEEGRTVEPGSTEPVVEAVEQPVVTESLSAAAPTAAAAQTEAMTEVPAAVEQPAAQTADAATADQYRPVGPEEALKETYNPVAEVPASVITAPEYRPLAAEKTATQDATAEPAKAAAVSQMPALQTNRISSRSSNRHASITGAMICPLPNRPTGA